MLYVAMIAIAQGKKVGYFGPNYTYVNPVYNKVLRKYGGAVETKNKQEHFIAFKNGAEMEFWSLDNNEDAGRSRDYDVVLIDEAGLMSKLITTWREAIMMTLADRQGFAIFAGTPKGQNDFYDLFMKGVKKEDGVWSAFRAPTMANPYMKPEFIEMLQKDMTEDVKQQEIHAKFLDDRGQVFRKVSQYSLLDPLSKPEEGHEYVMGIDVARVNDYFVVSVLDKTEKKQVYMERWQESETMECVAKIMRIFSTFKPSLTLMETNQGRAIFEILRDKGMPIIEIHNTNESKRMLIENLAVMIESGELLLLNNVIQMGELMAYQVERTKSGNLVFGAPGKKHDDTVMALACGANLIKTQDTTFLERAWGTQLEEEDERNERVWNEWLDKFSAPHEISRLNKW